MHGLHYNHPKKFTEKKFKEWSKKARELRDSYNDEQLDKFKIKLKNLSNIYITKAEIIKILRLSRRYFTHNAHRAILQAEPQGS